MRLRPPESTLGGMHTNRVLCTPRERDQPRTSRDPLHSTAGCRHQRARLLHARDTAVRRVWQRLTRVTWTGRLPVAAVAVSLLLSAAAPLRAQRALASDRERVEQVRTKLLARIAQTPGAHVGLSVRELETNRSLAINGDSVFHAASTMKVPVLFALFQAFQTGAIDGRQRMRLVNQFASIVDGSPYALSVHDDSDSAVYAWVGTDVPLRDLATRMITHSSNLATNALIAQLDPVRITALTRTLGATQLIVRRGVEDNLAFRAGLNNITTANDLTALFVALHRGEVANPEGTRAMLSILEAQAFNDEIPAGVPAGIRVAHKTGSITATLHDSGIVYPPSRSPYALTVLTRGIPDGKLAAALIADCSRIVWEWLVESR